MKINKKGAVELLSNIIGYLLLLFIAIIGGILATYIKDGALQNTQREIEIYNGKTELIMFLRQPVTYNNNQYSMSELIIDSQYDIKLRGEVRKIIKKRMNEKYGEYWNLEIKYSDKIVPLGNSYKKQKIGVWTKFFTKTFLSSTAPQIIILPLDEIITTKVILPGYESKNIEVTQKHWILLAI